MWKTGYGIISKEKMLSIYPFPHGWDSSNLKQKTQPNQNPQKQNKCVVLKKMQMLVNTNDKSLGELFKKQTLPNVRNKLL